MSEKDDSARLAEIEEVAKTPWLAGGKYVQKAHADLADARALEAVAIARAFEAEVKALKDGRGCDECRQEIFRLRERAEKAEAHLNESYAHRQETLDAAQAIQKERDEARAEKDAIGREFQNQQGRYAELFQRCGKAEADLAHLQRDVDFDLRAIYQMALLGDQKAISIEIIKLRRKIAALAGADGAGVSERPGRSGDKDLEGAPSVGHTEAAGPTQASPAKPAEGGKCPKCDCWDCVHGDHHEGCVGKPPSPSPEGECPKCKHPLHTDAGCEMAEPCACKFDGEAWDGSPSPEPGLCHGTVFRMDDGKGPIETFTVHCPACQAKGA